MNKNTNRRRTVALVGAAAVLAGLGGAAFGLAIHEAQKPAATAPIQTITVHNTTTPASPITPVIHTTPVTPTEPVHPVIPDYSGTIKMTITNNTDATLHLDGSDNPYGDWIVSPQSELAPGASETVSASTWNQKGFGVDVTYDADNGSSVVFMANNYAGQTDTSGTRVDGSNTSHWVVQATVDQGAPDMTASYTVMPGLL